MPNLSSDSLIFYPAYCFPLSPTYNTWARLTAADVHALKEREGYDSQNIYFHLNHPIKWVRLVGVIVALDCYYNRWSMVLDDGCGATIELSCKRPILPKPTNYATLDKPKSPSVENNSQDEIVLSQDQDPAYAGLTDTGRTINLKGYDVGAVVKVKGGLRIFGGEQQVRLERISILPSTNDELTAWAETSAFRRDILSTSWVVGDQELRRARRKAEGLERRHERHLAERKGRRKNQNNVGEEELMGQRSKKEKASSHRRRRRTEDEGRINNAANEEDGQGGRTSTQQQREKMEEDEMERAKEEEEGLMLRRRSREQDEGKKNPRKTTKFSSRVHRGEVRIPKDQQHLLNREEFLLSEGSIVNGKGEEKGKEKLMSKKKFGHNKANDNHSSCHPPPFPPPPPAAGKYDALGL